MRWWLALAAGAALAGCRNQEASVVGKWTLYVPADMKAAAAKKHETVPKGTLALLEDGSCQMDLQKGLATWTFRGKYTRNGLDLRIDGTETVLDGSPSKTEVSASGVFSSDLKTVRVHGRDFQRK